MASTILRSAHESLYATKPLPRPLRTLRVALAGCGVVGSALVRLIQSSKHTLAAHHGLRIEIARVLVRDLHRDRGLGLEPSIFTNDVSAFLSVDADIVVEAIGGVQPAGRIAGATLARGRRLVTANKEFISTSGPELNSLAFTNKTTLDFDAAVGGSVPIVRTLRDALGGVPPVSIRGILNGTSNYVLTCLERGDSYEQATESARNRGLAEADLSRDLDGRDVAAKIAILAWVAFRIPPSRIAVRRTGLLPDPGRFVSHATALGAKVRLIAECVSLPGGCITTVVEPVILTPESALGSTLLENNRAEIDLGWGHPLCLSGPGAGGAPTATALLSDILRETTAAPGDLSTRRDSDLSCIEDPRAHRWVIAARSSADSLVQFCEGASIPVVDVATLAADTRVITGAARRAQLDPLLLRLRQHHGHPIVARLETPLSVTEPS